MAAHMKRKRCSIARQVKNVPNRNPHQADSTPAHGEEGKRERKEKREEREGKRKHPFHASSALVSRR